MTEAVLTERASTETALAETPSTETASGQTPIRLAVVVGSTRDGRLGETVAGWFTRLLAQRSDFDVDVIDLREIPLPPVQSAAHPKSGRYTPDVAAYASRIAAADAYILVTPEYNHGYPASIKLALDAVYAEWNAKPASFVAYGGLSGGMRAVEQLRLVLAELHVVAIRDIVAIPFAMRMFDEAGELIDDGMINASAKLMLDSLAWWAAALRTARAEHPYGG